MDNEVAAARAKLAARFGKAQLGGKGTYCIEALTNGVRRARGSSDFDSNIFYRHPEKSVKEN
jgi:hypothetical protein